MRLFLYWSRLIESVDYGRFSHGVTITVGGWSPNYIEPVKESYGREDAMAGIIDFIAVVSFGLACFRTGVYAWKDTVNAKK